MFYLGVHVAECSWCGVLCLSDVSSVFCSLACLCYRCLAGGPCEGGDLCDSIYCGVKDLCGLSDKVCDLLEDLWRQVLMVRYLL